MPDREKLIEAAQEAFDAAAKGPVALGDAIALGDTLVALGRVLAALPAEPEQEPVIHHVCGDDCSEPVQATDPVRAALEVLLARYDAGYKMTLHGPWAVARAALAADREGEKP